MSAPTAAVLVTGAGGFVGRRVCPRLAEVGFRVIATGRDPDSLTVAAAERRRAPELGPGADWRPALAGIGAVVHLAARAHMIGEAERADAEPLYRRINAEGTVRLAEQAAAAGVRRLVFVSTIKVNGETSPPGRPFREDDPPAPADAYGRAKLAAEEGLRRVASGSGLRVTILRPPLVYGPGVRGNFRQLLALCRTGLPLPLASVHNRRSLIFVDNLADAIRCCLADDRAVGETYLLRDGTEPSIGQLVGGLRRAMGRPARLFPMPVPLLGLAAALAGRRAVAQRLLDTLAVDDGKIRRDLGWSPPTSLDSGLVATAAWFDHMAGGVADAP